MSNAWETTTDDIHTVLVNEGYTKNITQKWLKELHGKIDSERVEESALYGDEMEEQTDYAYDNIQLQLVELGVL